MALGNVAAYQAPVAAGVAFAAFGVFGVLPLLLGLAVSLRLDETATASWIFATYFGSGVVTLALSAVRREPYGIGISTPAAIVLAAAGAHYSWPVLLGASVVTGAIIALGSFLGMGRASIRILPLPLVMGMFAGSILRLATDAFAQLSGQEPWIAASAILGYFATRLVTGDRVPATAGALAAGLFTAGILGSIPTDLPFVLTTPQVIVPELDLRAVATLVVPLLVLIVGTGNVQGIGFLQSQGYRPPTELLTFATGALSVVNGFFGAPAAGLLRVGAAIAAAPEAGDKERRWIACAFAGLVFIVVAFLAVPVTVLALELPRALVTTVGGLAIVGALLEALRIAFRGPLSYSAFFALLIAFTPFAPLGIEAAFWSLFGGLIIAFLFERETLVPWIRNGTVQ